jgi:hypothetical protein
MTTSRRRTWLATRPKSPPPAKSQRRRTSRLSYPLVGGAYLVAVTARMIVAYRSCHSGEWSPTLVMRRV